MSYKSKFGGTQIRSQKYNNLSIGYDADNSDDLFPPNKKKIYPVFLFTPYMEDEMHHHIQLTKFQAGKLRDWLDAYIKDTK